MAIQEKTMQGGGLPEILMQLLGSKSSTKQSTKANTGPLQQVFNQASQPMDQGLYDNLIASIMQSGAAQVPTLTAALANATGGRSSGNSALALALQEQMLRSSKDSATAILSQKNAQQQVAGNAAAGIAQATKSSTTTEKAGTGGNPLALALGGFLLNQADKRGWMDKLGGMFGGTAASPTAMASNFPVSAPSFGTADSLQGTPQFSPNMLTSVPGSDFGLAGEFTAPTSGGIDFSNFGGGGDPGFSDLLSGFDFGGASDAFGSFNLPDFGGALTGGVGSFGDISMLDENLFNFIPSFADGGVVRNRANMGPAQRRQGQAAINEVVTPTLGSSASTGLGSNTLMEMITRMNGAAQANPAKQGAPMEATSGIGDTTPGRTTAGGELNRLSGNPLGQKVGTAFASAIIGMMAPQIAYGVTGSIPAAQLANPLGRAAGLPIGSQLGALIAMARAAMAEHDATTAIESAEDPLGAFLAGLAGTGALVGDTSGLSSDNRAAGANALSSVTGMDEISALLATSSGFGTMDPGQGGGSIGGFGDRGPGGSSGEAGAVAGGATPAGPGDFADGGMITGPGTGTSDSILAKNKTPGGKPIKVSNGERIIPADTALRYKDLFDHLVAMSHTPVKR